MAELTLVQKWADDMTKTLAKYRQMKTKKSAADLVEEQEEEEDAKQRKDGDSSRKSPE